MKKTDLIMKNIGEGKYTPREILLSGAVLFLSGTILGMLCSPRKNQVIGSNNSNNSASSTVSAPKKKEEETE